MNSRLLILGAVGILLGSYLPTVLAAEVTSSATVTNGGPVVESIVLDVEDDDSGTAGLQVSPVPGANRTLPLHVDVSDHNGWNDIKKVEYRILAPDGSVVTSGSLSMKGNGHGRSAKFNRSFDFPYWMPAGTYTVEATAKDKPGTSTTANWTFQVVPTLAMVLDSESISFGGNHGPGTTNHDAPSVVRVRNMGNVVIDLGVSGSDLVNATYDAAIPIGKIRYSLSSNMSNERPLTRSLHTDESFDLAPGANSVRPVYFDLHMPTGDEQYLPAATYQGRLVISAVVSS